MSRGGLGLTTRGQIKVEANFFNPVAQVGTCMYERTYVCMYICVYALLQSSCAGGYMCVYVVHACMYVCTYVCNSSIQV